MGAEAHSVSEDTVTIEAPGAVLAGVLVSVAAPQVVVSVNAATGIKAAHYLPFARWLAQEKQATVLVWDYRDFGASGAPYQSDATMTEWAITDPAAVRDWLERRFPHLPLWVIGHSLGGMGLAFQPGTERIDRIITVAAGQGHVSDHPWPFQALARLLWFVVGPISVAALGYLPGRRLGLGNNLPRGVFWQWRKWLVSRGSLPADPSLGGVRSPGFAGPLTLVALADDVMIPPRAVWRMAGWHPRARVEKRLVRPADFGLDRIGHVHPFAARNAAIWPALIG